MERGALRQFLETLPDDLLAASQLGRGNGIRVAIIDSGIDTAHPDLKANTTRAVSVEVTPSRQAQIRNVSLAEDPQQDVAGHGTACADIIGELAPECEIWSVRALGPSCRGDSVALLAALQWAIAEGADVINLSLGTQDRRVSEPLRELADLAYRKSLLVVVAANNVPGVTSYPAIFSSLVCVDSIFSEDREQFFFRFGEMSELEAPGVYIDAAWPGRGRKLVTGTSFACPHISGHIARIMSANPGITPFQVKTVLFAMGIRNRQRQAASGDAHDDA